MKASTLVEIICFLLVLLFVYAALSKLFNFNSFKEQLHLSPFLSKLSFVSWLLPSIELITAILLAVDTFRLAGLFISAGMLLIFTLYIAAMLLYAKHLPCSCGGVLKELSWKQHLVFNIFFLLLSATGIGITKKAKTKNMVVQQFERDAS